MAETDRMADVSDVAGGRVIISHGGRIVIPAAIRKALGVVPGDALSLRLEGNELRILPQREAVRRAQELVSRRVAKGRSLVKELREERRGEAAGG